MTIVSSSGSGFSHRIVADEWAVAVIVLVWFTVASPDTSWWSTSSSCVRRSCSSFISLLLNLLMLTRSNSLLCVSFSCCRAWMDVRRDDTICCSVTNSSRILSFVSCRFRSSVSSCCFCNCSEDRVLTSECLSCWRCCCAEDATWISEFSWAILCIIYSLGHHSSFKWFDSIWHCCQRLRRTSTSINSFCFCWVDRSNTTSSLYVTTYHVTYLVFAAMSVFVDISSKLWIRLLGKSEFHCWMIRVLSWRILYTSFPFGSIDSTDNLALDSLSRNAERNLLIILSVSLLLDCNQSIRCSTQCIIHYN